MTGLISRRFWAPMDILDADASSYNYRESGLPKASTPEDRLKSKKIAQFIIRILVRRSKLCRETQPGTYVYTNRLFGSNRSDCEAFYRKLASLLAASRASSRFVGVPLPLSVPRIVPPNGPVSNPPPNGPLGVVGVTNMDWLSPPPPKSGSPATLLPGP